MKALLGSSTLEASRNMPDASHDEDRSALNLREQDTKGSMHSEKNSREAQLHLVPVDGVSEKISKQVDFNFFRSDRKRSPNGP